MKLLVKQVNNDESSTLAYKDKGKIVIFTGISPHVSWVLEVSKDNMRCVLQKIEKDGVEYDKKKNC